MIVLVTDKDTAESLNGQYGNDCYLNFIETEQGFIVGENVLKDPNFKEILPQLNKLKKAEFIKPSNDI
jgi:hypothetical protein